MGAEEVSTVPWHLPLEILLCALSQDSQALPTSLALQRTVSPFAVNPCGYG